MIQFGILIQANLSKSRFNNELYNPSELLKKNNANILNPEGHIKAKVKDVIDGDTFSVIYRGIKFKVRLLDVDTPESLKKGVSVQTFSREASNNTKNYLFKKEVDLYFEKGLKDRYNRLLAHVFLEDGFYLNGFLVRNGFARAVSYSPNTRYKYYFINLQNKAIFEKLGFWRLHEKNRPFRMNKNGQYIPIY